MNEVKSIRMMKKCEWVAQQTREASQTGFVHIRNGKRTPVWIAYRCYYCGEYFNHAGAEKHFGTSRIEYNETESKEGEIEVANISFIEPDDWAAAGEDSPERPPEGSDTTFLPLGVKP